MKKLRAKSGFGLIELLAVLIIIGILFVLKINFLDSKKSPMGKALQRYSPSHIQEQITTGQHVKNQVRDIQAMAKKRYVG